MKALNIYWDGKLVGKLFQREDGLLKFQYDETWLSNPDAIALSRSLPLQEKAFPHNKTRIFFSGLLPEAGPRSKVASILGLSEENDFGLLEELGGDCAGALTILPETYGAPSITKHSYRGLTEEELSNLVTQLPYRPLLADEEGLRLSLAGAQDKLPVVYQNGSFSLPISNTPSTHILKPEPQRFPGLASNEAFCMRLAKRVGLNVPSVETVRIAETACLLIERYDRRQDASGRTERIHQEDFCQALGFPPEKKYQKENGPTLSNCIKLIKEWSIIPVLDISSFIDGIIFNSLIGNADAHGKNFSFLYKGSSRRLAPFYDLVCTLAWPEITKNLAMRIGSAQMVTEVTLSHFQQLAEREKLGSTFIKERVHRMCNRVTQALSEIRLEEAMDLRVSEIIHGRMKTLQI